MSRVNWREVCKFAAGAAFVGTIANTYLWAYDISTPFPLFGYTIQPWLFGVRAILSILIFAICVYVAVSGLGGGAHGASDSGSYVNSRAAGERRPL